MEKIIPIQVLRAVAVLAVVVAHAQIYLDKPVSAPGALPDLNFGGAGVDLFFVISGFIMVYTSRPLFGQLHGARTFLTRRVIRIVPLYWLVTTLYLVAGLMLPGFQKSYSGEFVAASYFFIPMRGPDAFLMPIVGHGWSLNYEMMFYLIFALALWLPQRLAVGAASLALLAMMVGAPLLRLTSDVFMAWTSYLMLQFVYGMLIGLAYCEGVRLPRSLGVVLMAAACASIYWLNAVLSGFSHGMVIGLAVAVIVAGATLSRISLDTPAWRTVAIVGDASYALYLLHSIPIHGAMWLSQSAPVDFVTAPWLYLLAIVAAAIMLGLATYYLVEVPTTRALRSLLGRKQRSRTPAVALTPMPAVVNTTGSTS